MLGINTQEEHIFTEFSPENNKRSKFKFCELMVKED